MNRFCDPSLKLLGNVTRTDSCWLWRGTPSKNGYGRIHHHGSRKYTHRLSYELFVGEIPPGLVVCHRCDVPSCVNPEHLFLGTQADNVIDMDKKGRRYVGPMSVGSANPSSILSDSDVSSIKAALRASNERGLPVRLARQYGVCSVAIHDIKHGKTWKHIP